MAKCSPANGGCWFCGTDDPIDLGWWFCYPLDTNVHVQCVIDADKKLSDNPEFAPEAEIIIFEFRDQLNRIYEQETSKTKPKDDDCGC